MSRFVNLLLIILVVVAFFFGVRVGKTIQAIDTPVKTKTEVKKILVEPTTGLSRYTLLPCKFGFVVPSSVAVILSSQSALLTQQKESLTLSCEKKNKSIVASGSSTLRSLLKEGFDNTFTVAP